MVVVVVVGACVVVVVEEEVVVVVVVLDVVALKTKREIVSDRREPKMAARTAVKCASESTRTQQQRYPCSRGCKQP